MTAIVQYAYDESVEFLSPVIPQVSRGSWEKSQSVYIYIGIASEDIEQVFWKLSLSVYYKGCDKESSL